VRLATSLQAVETKADRIRAECRPKSFQQSHNCRAPALTGDTLAAVSMKLDETVFRGHLFSYSHSFFTTASLVEASLVDPLATGRHHTGRRNLHLRRHSLRSIRPLAAVEADQSERQFQLRQLLITKAVTTDNDPILLTATPNGPVHFRSAMQRSSRVTSESSHKT